MTFFEALTKANGNLFKASQIWCASRGWNSTAREEWYETWRSSELPAEVEAAVKKYYNKD